MIKKEAKTIEDIVVDAFIYVLKHRGHFNKFLENAVKKHDMCYDDDDGECTNEPDETPFIGMIKREQISESLHVLLPARIDDVASYNEKDMYLSDFVNTLLRHFTSEELDDIERGTIGQETFDLAGEKIFGKDFVDAQKIQTSKNETHE
jgi:hypothetical protein